MHEYIDRAQSARSDRRVEFQQMIADSKKKKFQAVIVHKLDRFSRDRYDHAIYRKKLRDNGVSLISVLENLDDSPESIILESVLEGVSEYYSKNLARETRKGLKEIALKAKFTGGCPPFGFDVDENNNYIINKREAEAVRKIFNACLNCVGYDQLLIEFDRQGLRTKFGKPFSKTSFNAILKNRKYIGDYIYYPEGSAREKKSQPIVLEGALPQIVDKSVFWEVQKIMEKRKHTGRVKAIEPYLLSVFFQENFGMNISDFVNERIFKPLKIKKYAWENFGNYCAGATGLYLNFKDFHKLGQLLFNYGKLDGKQIVPENWVREMTKAQFDCADYYKKERVFPKLAAGYFTWISKDGIVFRDGSEGQYIICDHKNNILITIMATEKNMSKVTECLRGIY